MQMETISGKLLIAIGGMSIFRSGPK